MNETLTKERPIIFSGPMVRAILNGRKTQTRRIIKQQPERGVHECPYVPSGYSHGSMGLDGACGCVEIRSPYGKPGDRLWVRETWAKPSCDCSTCSERHLVNYRATWSGEPYVERWRPSIHMPRWASRILLEVVSVRVERLQEISDFDALAEGCSTSEMRHGDRIASVYARLWESIHGKGSWEANPWVFVVEFKQVEGGSK